jgi:anti-sigma regulatory factor (Ser/Thr protein kinase)
VTSYELQLEPERSNVSLARRFVMDCLHRLNRDAYADVAELLTSELVTNAVLHAGTAINVTVSDDAGGLRVEVTDASVTAPARRLYSAEAATGRGLGLVEALASQWGTRTDAGGKTVWFTLSDDALVA